jgi:hypothetical protein
VRVEDEIAQAQRCVHGASGQYCRERATVHIFIEGDEHTFACEEHAAWWDSHPHRDQHPTAGACGLPNTTWLYTRVWPDWPGGVVQGRCVLTGLDDLTLAELAEATA